MAQNYVVPSIYQDLSDQYQGYFAFRFVCQHCQWQIDTRPMQSKIATTQNIVDLGAGLIGGFFGRIVRAEVSAIHVDRHQGFGLVDDDRSARGERHRSMERGFDLLLHMVETCERRIELIPGVVRKPRPIARHEAVLASSPFAENIDGIIELGRTDLRQKSRLQRFVN